MISADADNSSLLLAKAEITKVKQHNIAVKKIIIFFIINNLSISVRIDVFKSVFEYYSAKSL